MDKLSSTAKRLDTFLRILFWICAILGGAAVVFMGLSLILGDKFSLLSASRTSMILNGISIPLDLNDPAISEIFKERFKSFMLIGMVCFMFGLLFVLGFIYQIRQILKPMKATQPFDSSIHLRFRNLAYYTLAFGVIYNIEKLISNKIIAGILEFSSIVYESNHYFFDATFLIIAMFLFLFSYIFRYGAELQQQADETL